MAPKLPGRGIGSAPFNTRTYKALGKPYLGVVISFDGDIYGIKTHLPKHAFNHIPFPRTQNNVGVFLFAKSYFIINGGSSVAEITEAQAEAYQRAVSQCLRLTGATVASLLLTWPTIRFYTSNLDNCCEIIDANSMVGIGAVPLIAAAAQNQTPATSTATSKTYNPQGTFWTSGTSPPAKIVNITWGPPPPDLDKTITKIALSKCECGATACKSMIHSPWCPLK